MAQAKKTQVKTSDQGGMARLLLSCVFVALGLGWCFGLLMDTVSAWRTLRLFRDTANGLGGALCALLGLVMAVYVLVSLFSGNSVHGWASTMMSIWLLGGLQLMALGMIGEYVGKIYMETKRRPKFILEEHLK